MRRQPRASRRSTAIANRDLVLRSVTDCVAEQLEQRVLLAYANPRANTLVGDPTGFERNTQSESSTIVWQPAGSAPRVLTFFNDWLTKRAMVAPQGTGFTRSIDGGNSFDDKGTLPYTDPAGLQATTDPVVARYDDGSENGIIYFAGLSTSTPRSVVVFTSLTAGDSFVDRDTSTNSTSEPSVLFTNSGADKEWIAVDNFAG